MEARFNVDLSRLVELLPFGMRVTAIVRLLRAGFAPYSEHLSAIFRTARADDWFRLRHNGQVCLLRAALNARFHSSLNGVYFQIGEKGIEKAWLHAKREGSTPQQVVEISHTYALTEPKPELKLKEGPDGILREVLTYPSFAPPLAPSEVRPDELYDFIVYVPSDLYQSCLPQIKRLVAEYHLLTRRPQYEPINS